MNEPDTFEALRCAAGQTAPDLMGRLDADPRASAFLARVIETAPYLHDLACRHPAELEAFLFSDVLSRLVQEAADMETAVREASNEAGAMRALRRYKQKLALGVAIGDLSGRLSVEVATAALSEGAESALKAAVARALADEAALGRLKPHDMAEPEKGSGYAVIGMGKLGARELNYSSDIDLIVFYDPERAPLREGLEPGPFFVRLTQKIVKLMQERTADSYVFRTDLRLRPDPGATAVAINIDSALTYYESLGQTWERAAMIKARAVAGDLETGEDVLKQLAPFVWRRYLDYAAIADIHSIKRRINTHKGFGAITAPGHDVKLGRGGIREIEFFVQTQQLIAGGRDERLRHRSTLLMLDRLTDAGWIEKKTADDLKEAYRFLRRVEHAIQMRNDEQTHRLPHEDEQRHQVARLLGWETLESFDRAVVKTLAKVHAHFTHLFERGEAASETLDIYGEEVSAEVLGHIAALGYKKPQEVVRAIKGLMSGHAPATRAQKSRDRLKALVPSLLAAFGNTDYPDGAINAFEQFVKGLPAGVQLFSLLATNPSLLGLLARIMGVSPRLADYIARRPHILDAVLDPAFFGALPDGDEIARRIAEALNGASQFEEALDLLRIVGKEQQFLIGVRLIGGALTPAEAAKAYTVLADRLLEAALSVASADLSRQHGHVPGSRATILAMGKLGGEEMTAASDLDLILIYDVPEGVSQSDGKRPLAASQWYQRLTQRLIAAISAPTGQGSLYEVDFRLRPSGNAGPLATSLSSFRLYQMEQAWVWEHQALTRARPVGGDAGLRETLTAVIRETLARPRDADKIRKEVADMRARIEGEKATTNRFDLKQVPGGQVDVEFIAQALTLIHAHRFPDLIEPRIGAAFERMVEMGVLERQDAELFSGAAALYRDLTQIQRLCLDGAVAAEALHDGVRDLLTRVSGLPDFAVLEAQLGHTQKLVRERFDQLLGVVREADNQPDELS